MKYDVVIIGAGSCGAILANELTADPNRSVLLLEAGPDYPDFAHLPDELKYGYDASAEGPIIRTPGGHPHHPSDRPAQLAVRCPFHQHRPADAHTQRQGHRRLKRRQLLRLPPWRPRRFRRLGFHGQRPVEL